MSASKIITPEMKENLASIQRDGLDANSPLGRKLMTAARQVEGQSSFDMSWVSGYSIKFEGCHHVTQWASKEQIEENDQNADQNGDDVTLNASNGRIQSKGIVRFRLCPTGSCTNNFSVGCASNYGEYVVDMHQFLKYYVAWQIEETATKCANTRNTCYKKCYSSTSSSCYTTCYSNNGVEASLCASVDANGDSQFAQADGDGNVISLEDYLECAEYEIATADGESLSHYLGPYCSNQGGDIRLGFFQDQYCSIPSANQASYFQKLTGVVVPFTDKSIVTTNCMSCEYKVEENGEAVNDYYNYDADGNKNYYVAAEVNELCGTMYMSSGKCESQFNKEDFPYPETGACTYIESVKRLKDDGIIRADQKISSKPAAVSIGVFTSLAVLMGGYVYYLKSKIARSRVNLAGATTSLA
ncbi:hypothetical protein ACHAXA_002317 [Cyclostephanos tholiformis]|uniref:Uncharacterized protein n=1 Tax=Cyclostephanos tholiformis TaxID=382380 RepID=A0ABD3SRA8_9STRA